MKTFSHLQPGKRQLFKVGLTWITVIRNSNHFDFGVLNIQKERLVVIDYQSKPNLDLMDYDILPLQI